LPCSLPLIALLFVGLVLLRPFPPRAAVIESKMVGKPLPAFALPAGASDRPALASAQFAKGKPRLLNIFASWCVPCAAESPQLDALKQAGIPIDGIAIRDRARGCGPFPRPLWQPLRAYRP
jgi:cytochrome c biogenesis protein CcmG/thiol:disulfide interchange protein DsbE